MKINDYPLAELDPILWNGLLDLSGSISPFCRYEWLKLLSAANPAWKVGVLLAGEQGRPEGGLAYAEIPGGLVYQSHALPWGTPSGVIIAPGADAGLAHELIGTWAGRQKKRLFRRLSITFPDRNPPGLEILGKFKFRLNVERSFVISLAGRSFEAWESSLSDAVKNQNRQAERRGAVFSELSDESVAREVYSLAGHTARRHRRPGPLLSERFYRLLLDSRGPLANAPGFVRIFMVRVDSKPSAFSVCLVYSGRLWLWDYGADQSTFEARPNNLMYHNLVRLAFELGLTGVDLGAVPDGASSLQHFKCSFGARPYERLSAVCASPLFRLGVSTRAFFNRLAGG